MASVTTKKRARPLKDPVSERDVKIVVKRALGSDYKLVNYHVRTFSEEKIGFMGSHRHLVVTLEKDGSTEVRTFFSKSIPYEIEQQARVIEESNVFNKEADFYKYVAPELLTSVKDKSWLAHCYLIKEDAMIFEDLKSRNFKLKGKILDTSALKSALASLAKLHASSILAEERLGKSFIELYPDVMKECLFINEGTFRDWFTTGVDVAVALAKNLGLDETNVEAICHRMIELVSSSKIRRNVVCHGDAWSYNLMFDDTEPIPRCAMVDFQLVRYAPAMADVLQLVYLTTRRDYREKNERELLSYYHEVFCGTLRENNGEVELPALIDVLKEYEEMRLVGIVTASLYYPINLIEGIKCAEMTKDSEGFHKLMFQDRVQLVIDMMKIDSAYNERIAEIIAEMTQRARQLLM